MEDFTTYDIDLNGIYSADELHDLLRETLPLPEYYGGTLDALFDVLTAQSDGWALRFRGMAAAEAVMGKYIRSLKRMCARAAEENPKFSVSFED